MGNSIDKNKIQGNDNLIIGGDQYNISNYITNTNDIKRTLYREPFIFKQIKKSCNLIKTAHCDEAIKQLETKNSIMFVGCSGIGKTCLSHIICDYFMENENYSFRFVSTPKEEDFYNILNIISENENKKELIIIDDFLGDSKLDLSDAKISSLENLIKSLNNFGNKKFIFTTRKTILKQLTGNCKAISAWIKSSLTEIDLDTYREEDNAKIFIYYCQKNGIVCNIKDLIEKKLWNDTTLANILKHKNFTPLVIKFATEECKNVLSKDYSSIISSLLEHPEDVWEKEIKALDTFSLEYMNILLSLSNSNNIKQEIADECFRKYIESTKKEADFTFKRIHDNVKILIESVEDEYLYFAHPSLIEYLDKQITEKERDNIINSALYLEQIEKMDNTADSRYIRGLMNVAENKLPKIFSLNVMPLIINFKEDSHEFINIIWTHYLKYLYKFKINDAEHQPIVIEILKQILDLEHYIFMFYSDDITNIFSLNYDFREILESDKYLQILFSHTNSLNIWYLLSKAVEKSVDAYDYSKMEDFIQDSLLEKLTEIGAEQLEAYDIEGYVDNEMDNIEESEIFDYDDIIDAVRDCIFDDCDFSSAQKAIEDTLKKHLIFNFNMERIDNNDIFECFWENQFIADDIIDILDKNYA